MTVDINSVTWKVIEAHLRARLADLRERNDGEHDFAATQKLRGQIIEVKMLLSLPEDIAKPKMDFSLED